MSEQDLFPHVLVWFLVAALQPGDLVVHVGVVVPSYQGQPAEERRDGKKEGNSIKELKVRELKVFKEESSIKDLKVKELKFSPSKYPETR